MGTSEPSPCCRWCSITLICAITSTSITSSPSPGFTPARLKSEGFSEEEVPVLREFANCLPNLQLLGGAENQEKRSMLPVEWLASFESDEKRSEYANLHLLGSVPNDLRGFGSFYSARRERLTAEIASLLA